MNVPTTIICTGLAEVVIEVRHARATDGLHADARQEAVVVTLFPEKVRFVNDTASDPPWKKALTETGLVLVNVTATTFVFCTFPAIPNTNAATTAARITVTATIKITPMTGETASSFFFVNAINQTPFKMPSLDIQCISGYSPFLYIHIFVVNPQIN